VPDATDKLLDAVATNESSEPPAGNETVTPAPEKVICDPKEQDPLTGLINRQGFLRELEAGIKVFPESGQEQAVLYILLDNFTGIREAIGTAASDNMIVEVSRLISENCNTPDAVARFGDCVFTILHHSDSINGIQDQAEKLRHSIEDYITEINGQAVMTTASIGICVINDYTTDPQNILNRADLACEVARSSGGNQLQIHSTIIDEQLSNENMDEWAELIRKTLDDERFYLVYQPAICLGEDPYKRYEVLLRIVDEDGKIVLPGKFMSLADNLGLSHNIDLWVIDSALKKLAESNDNNILFFIKLSVNTLRDASLPRWIQDKLTAYSLNSSNVVFEIPENIAINNLKNTMLFTRAMRNLGCKVALEHYAAATQPQLLKHIQTDYLKIDGVLVSSLATTDESRSTVRAIIDRARQFDLKCIAEHVDSAASLAMLWELGADYAQGNFIQEPSKEIDYDFFGEIETHDIPQTPDYYQTSKPQEESA
jgi:diguanylate cyclase (GGDEF)-like protein